MNDIEYKSLLNDLHQLKEISKNYQYIARDGHGELVVFKRKPHKELNFWFTSGYGPEFEKRIGIQIFSDISWLDKAPRLLEEEIRKVCAIHDIAYDEV